MGIKRSNKGTGCSWVVAFSLLKNLKRENGSSFEMEKFLLFIQIFISIQEESKILWRKSQELHACLSLHVLGGLILHRKLLYQSNLWHLPLWAKSCGARETTSWRFFPDKRCRKPPLVVSKSNDLWTTFPEIPISHSQVPQGGESEAPVFQQPEQRLLPALGITVAHHHNWTKKMAAPESHRFWNDVPKYPRSFKGI